MEKFTIWLPYELAEKVVRIDETERRKSKSNTIAALVGEAVEAREEREKRKAG